MVRVNQDDRSVAETVALQAVAFILASDGVREALLTRTGLTAETLQSELADPELLAAVLDFVLSEDDWVVAFAADAGIAPEEVATARIALPGGEDTHWT